MGVSLVAAPLDAIAAICHALRDAPSTPCGDRALASNSAPSSSSPQPTTRLLGELTDQEQQLRAAAAAANEEDNDPSAPRKRPRHHRQNQSQNQSQTTITAVAAPAPAAVLCTVPPAPTMFRLRLGLGDLEQTLLVRTANFLDDQGLEAIDAVSQLFHALGVVQKLCMARAGRWLSSQRWLGVERPVMPWPQWLDGVRFRGRMAGREHYARIVANGNPAIAGWVDFALVVDEAGVVRSRGRGDDGQLGHGGRENKEKLTVIAALLGGRIVQVSAGYKCSLALVDSGEVYAVYSFGDGYNGKRGHGDKENQWLVAAEADRAAGQASGAGRCWYDAQPGAAGRG